MVQSARNHQDFGRWAHPDDQVLIFPEHAFFAVAADALEERLSVRHSSMREGHEPAASRQAPWLRSADLAPVPIDDVAETADQPNVGMTLQQFQLLVETFWVG